MKRLLITTLVLIVVALAGCSKSSDEPQTPAVVLTRFPPPAWSVDETGRYPYSMTAAVIVPAKLSADMSEGDQLAAFVNDECRGKGVKVKVDTADVFFVLIRGLADEHSKVTFKYYSAKSSYMYQTEAVVNFLVDDVYGTAQKPKVLDLIAIK